VEGNPQRSRQRGHAVLVGGPHVEENGAALLGSSKLSGELARLDLRNVHVCAPWTAMAGLV
jgi:hypothetical protein